MCVRGPCAPCAPAPDCRIWREFPVRRLPGVQWRREAVSHGRRQRPRPLDSGGAAPRPSGTGPSSASRQRWVLPVLVSVPRQVQQPASQQAPAASSETLSIWVRWIDLVSFGPPSAPVTPGTPSLAPRSWDCRTGRTPAARGACGAVFAFAVLAISIIAPRAGLHAGAALLREAQANTQAPRAK